MKVTSLYYLAFRKSNPIKDLSQEMFWVSGRYKNTRSQYSENSGKGIDTANRNVKKNFYRTSLYKDSLFDHFLSVLTVYNI